MCRNGVSCFNGPLTYVDGIEPVTTRRIQGPVAFRYEVHLRLIPAGSSGIWSCSLALLCGLSISNRPGLAGPRSVCNPINGNWALGPGPRSSLGASSNLPNASILWGAFVTCMPNARMRLVSSRLNLLSAELGANPSTSAASERTRTTGPCSDLLLHVVSHIANTDVIESGSIILYSTSPVFCPAAWSLQVPAAYCPSCIHGLSIRRTRLAPSLVACNRSIQAVRTRANNVRSASAMTHGTGCLTIPCSMSAMSAVVRLPLRNPEYNPRNAGADTSGIRGTISDVTSGAAIYSSPIFLVGPASGFSDVLRPFVSRDRPVVIRLVIAWSGGGSGPSDASHRSPATPSSSGRRIYIKSSAMSATCIIVNKS